MKHFSFLKNVSMVCFAVAAVAGMSSCTNTASPTQVTNTLQKATNAAVFSYNDVSTVQGRDCKLAGPLPERTASALATWLHYSTAKRFTYTYPQYYVSFVTPQGQQCVWGLCSDAHGNFVGVLVPRNGVAAWDIPFSSAQTVYVCDGPQRKALSEAIMDSLKEYDAFRINARRTAGLTHWTYLISAPTDENAKRLAKLEEAKKQAEEAKAKKAAASVEDAASDSGDDLDLDSFGSDDGSDGDDSDDLSSSDDSGSDDSGEEEEEEE